MSVTTFNDTVEIDLNSTPVDHVGLQVVLSSGQTQDAVEVQDASSSVLARIDKDGKVTATSYTGDASPASVEATGSSTARTLAARFGEVVDVLDWGADPTGATDSASAIQSAINYGSAHAIPVRIPAGTYLLNSYLTLASNLMLFGDGMGQSVLRIILPATGSISTLYGLYVPTGSVNVLVTNLTVRSDNADASTGTIPQYGVYLNNSGSGTQTSNVILDKVELAYFCGSGVMSNNLGYSTNIRIVDCNIHDIGTQTQNVASIVHVGIGPPEAADVLIEGCYIANIGTGYNSSLDHAIYFSRSVTRARVVGNTLATNGIQIYGSGKTFLDVSIVGNTIKMDTDAGIILGGNVTGFAVTGNTITMGSHGSMGIELTGCQDGVVSGNVVNMSAGNGTGIAVYGAVDVVVAENHVFNSSTTFSVTGILVQDNAPITRLSLLDNTVNIAVNSGSPAQYAIWLYAGPTGGGMSDVTIRGNQVYNASYGIYVNATATGNSGILRPVVQHNRAYACNIGGGIRVDGGDSVINAVVTDNVSIDSTIVVVATNAVVRDNVATGVGNSGTNATTRGNLIAPVSPLNTASSNSATPGVQSDVPVLLSNTAATTVTNFINAKTGEVRVFRATNGNTTITHGTNILLKRQANWTMQAGDTLVLLNVSGVWYEVGSGSRVGGSVPTVSGSRGGNAALASLLTALAAMGLVVDSTTP